MARMVPFPMLPTRSSAERRLYEGFLEQLDDSYVCYHSVDWVMAGPRGPVTGEADFVIAHPTGGLLVMEVKGGSLSYDPATRRWTQTGRSGSFLLDKDPFKQADGELRSLIEILEAQPGWGDWKPSFGHALGVPDAIYDTAAHPGAPVHIVLDRRHLHALDTRVAEIMAFHRRPGRRFEAEGMDGVARALGFRVEVRTPLGLAFAEEDKKIVELTRDQAWIRTWVQKLRRAAVVGPAGSGKSLLATEIAKHMAEGGNRTLLTCFNRGIAAHLARETAGTPNLDVHHFHALAHRMATQAGIPVPTEVDTGPGSDFFEHRLPELLMEAAERLSLRYDVMVVDEAQDFRDHWWPALLALHADPDAGRLYLFADDGQNLYGGAVPDLIPEEARFPLSGNVRNCREIADFVSVFYRGEPAPESKGPPGRAVEILAYRDDEHLARMLRTVLTNLIEEEKVPAEQIAVLTPAGLAKSALRSRGSVNGWTLSEEPGPGEILATSIHAFKGLERPVVILAELGGKHDEDLDRYVYIGGSRARSHLIILATEDVAARLRAIAG